MFRTEDAVDILNIDNTDVRKTNGKIAMKENTRGKRSQRALTAITEWQYKEYGNLLAVAVDAARVRATIGEISDAIEV